MSQGRVMSLPMIAAVILLLLGLIVILYAALSSGMAEAAGWSLVIGSIDLLT